MLEEELDMLRIGRTFVVIWSYYHFLFKKLALTNKRLSLKGYELFNYHPLSYFSANKRLVYEEVKKAVERDRSMVKVSELSRHGLMEITRKRVCSLILNSLFSFLTISRNLPKPTCPRPNYWDWLNHKMEWKYIIMIWFAGRIFIWEVWHGNRGVQLFVFI